MFLFWGPIIGVGNDLGPIASIITIVQTIMSIGVMVVATVYAYIARRRGALEAVNEDATKKSIENLLSATIPPDKSVKRILIDFNPDNANQDGAWEQYVYQLRNQLSDHYNDLFIYNPSGFLSIVKSQVDAYGLFFKICSTASAIVSFFIMLLVLASKGSLFLLLAMPIGLAIGCYVLYRTRNLKRNDLIIARAYIDTMTKRGIYVQTEFTQRADTRMTMSMAASM